jgi:hypothetical protein
MASSNALGATMSGAAYRLTSEEIADFLEIISNNDRRLVALMKERAGRGAGVDTMPPAVGDPEAVGLIVIIDARSDTELAINAAKQAAEGYATAVAIWESDR